jgi:hypothetical protein
VHGVRAPDRLRRCFRQAEESHLPLSHEIGHRAGRLLDGHRAIDPMLIIEIDVVHAEPPERGIAGGFHVLGPAVLPDELSVRRAHVAEFGREDHLLALSFDRLADQDLVGEWPVDVGRVEERDAEVQGPMDRRDRLGVVAGAVEVRHPHAAESQRGDAQRLLLTSEFACFHGSSPVARLQYAVSRGGGDAAGVCRVSWANAGRSMLRSLTRRGVYAALGPADRLSRRSAPLFRSSRLCAVDSDQDDSDCPG